MAEEPLTAEREALVCVAEAAGDVVDCVLRILAVMEQQSAAVDQLVLAVRGVREELHDLSWPMRLVATGEQRESQAREEGE